MRGAFATTLKLFLPLKCEAEALMIAAGMEFNVDVPDEIMHFHNLLRIHHV